MTASGWDMWGQKDSFHYFSQPWAGDVDVKARKSKGNGSGNVANNWRTNPPQKDTWLRIVKKDVTIEFYTAPDGQDWTLRGTNTVFFPEDRYRVGLALTSAYD